MKVTTRFDYAKIQAEKAFNLRLMLAIEGDEQPEKQRSPLNLALVLDHSGSMSGPKLRNFKEATKQLVKMLSFRGMRITAIRKFPYARPVSGLLMGGIMWFDLNAMAGAR